ncbi:MAG: hemerythrin [Leadbetterella sp.]|nr:hemerythrin [Leadbetterella sp.]
MKSETVQSLVESAKIYQMVTERLDLIDNPAKEELTFESELMELILEFYSGDETDLPVEKLQKFSMMQVMYYLQASHKLYISKTLPEIEQSMAHIQRRYYETPQILDALVLFFNHYKTHFLEHIRMEERDFFPYLKKLHHAYTGGLSGEEITELLNNTSLNQFMDDHDAVEDELRNVSTIIHTYSEDEMIPLPFKVFLNQVELFEMDLRKHAIIEDHVLVPMAQKIEKELRERF